MGAEVGQGRHQKLREKPVLHRLTYLLCGIREQPSGPRGSVQPLASKKADFVQVASFACALSKELRSPPGMEYVPPRLVCQSPFRPWQPAPAACLVRLRPLQALEGRLTGPPGSCGPPSPPPSARLVFYQLPAPAPRSAQHLQGHMGNIPSLLALSALLGGLQRVNMVHLSVVMSPGFTFLEDYIPCPSSQMFPYQSILLIVPHHMFS